jgi:integrator complex subunit 1
MIIYFFIDLEALHSYRDQVSVIQRDAVWWLHTVLPKFMEIKPTEYVLWLVLFLPLSFNN